MVSFYEGPLNEAIATSVQESKVLGCFVTDDEEESKLWETDFLQDPIVGAQPMVPVTSLLSSQTVLLRLIAGSQEAGYLAQIFPIPKTPTFVLIKNGELKEYMASGISKEEFVRRISVAFQSQVPETPSRTASASRNLPQSSNDSPATTSTAPVTSNSTTSAPIESPPSASKKGKQPASDPPSVQSTKKEDPQKKAVDTKYALQRKKEIEDARKERERILARVEADKAARRHEAEQRSKSRANVLAHQQEEATKSQSSSNSQSKKPAHKECALQVRMFDGSTIRSKFPSSGTIRADVRKWVDANLEGDVPYNFKQVLTPLPNKDISLNEEEQDFQYLGLTPSATLILVPVKEFTEAYGSGGATGLIYKGASLGLGIVSGGVGLVTGTLGSIFGSGGASSSESAQQQPSGEGSTTSGSAVSGSSRIKVRTLRDQADGQNEQKFYNGNSLSFEPRRDDDKDKDN
ncbi:hypothetical protein HYFRA_00005644 [Hymenoscyphus fraxineus]|uniref:UBX domain-containing protein n=1 Tax=Hymenoscyphus fraxineus TaxID=746836 RepID=A0A9N9KTH7_9HELO|nr:hypothetical protein HYFRA_00005644 [Hymenoscyphus fraxineus]